MKEYELKTLTTQAWLDETKFPSLLIITHYHHLSWSSAHQRWICCGSEQKCDESCFYIWNSLSDKQQRKNAAGGNPVIPISLNIILAIMHYFVMSDVGGCDGMWCILCAFYWKKKERSEHTNHITLGKILCFLSELFCFYKKRIYVMLFWC